VVCNASPNLLDLLLCDGILVEEEVKNLLGKQGHKSLDFRVWFDSVRSVM
jgi:hypothetical protein